MGSYYIPNNKLKGESRILYIFTTKSLIYTAIGGLIGLVFYTILSGMGLKNVGIGILVVLALIGYGIGTIKFPSSGTSKIAKNVGGDAIDTVIMNYIKFNKNKKLYTYAVKRKEPDYSSGNSQSDTQSSSKNNKKN